MMDPLQAMLGNPPASDDDALVDAYVAAHFTDDLAPTMVYGLYARAGLGPITRPPRGRARSRSRRTRRRGSAARSSARSGDSGDDGPAEPERPHGLVDRLDSLGGES